LARVLVVSDLHFPGGARWVWGLLSLLGRVSVDAVVLAGDFVDSGSERALGKLLGLLRRRYRGPLLAVWGNHEHYLSWSRLRGGWDSLRLLERLRGVLEEHGALVLDGAGAVEVGGAWVVGAAGWYDYGFAPAGFTRGDFLRCNPFGAPVEALRRCERRRGPGCPPWWRNDCVYIRLPLGNEEYAAANAERLRRGLEDAPGPTLVVLHHAPRRELLRATGDPLRDFDHAYAGSPLLGEVIEEYRGRVAAVAYGHLHEASAARTMLLGGVPYVNAYPGYPGHEGYAVITIEDGKARVTVLKPAATSSL